MVLLTLNTKHAYQDVELFFWVEDIYAPPLRCACSTLIESGPTTEGERQVVELRNSLGQLCSSMFANAVATDRIPSQCLLYVPVGRTKNTLFFC